MGMKQKANTLRVGFLRLWCCERVAVWCESHLWKGRRNCGL